MPSARGDGISTVCPSATPFGLALGPTHPPRMDLAEEPLAFRGLCFSHSLRYSCRHSHSHALHRPSRDDFAGGGTLPYHRRPDGSGRQSGASAPSLTPLHCRRARTRPVSCYALFEGWLLLSQPPGCLRARTSFPTQLGLRGLSCRSGLLPSRRWSLAPTVSLALRAGGIRGSVGVGSLAAPRPAGALPPPAPAARLPLKAFRGEPAISGFGWHFTPTHSSSLDFEPSMGSGLQSGLADLHPGHG